MKPVRGKLSWLGYLLISIILFGLGNSNSWAQQPVLQPIQVVEAPFGMLTAAGVAGSADGRYLYVADQDDRVLLVLTRIAEVKSGR